MHISNLVSQYQRNANNNSTEELKGATSMQKMVSAVSEMTQGSVFEGTVMSVKGGKVILSLSTGQSIVAQLEGRVQLKVGTPMFFQVKSNSGSVLAIKPYTGNGSGGNPILMNALTTAGVPVTERNLEMVKAMMHQQMPIDKQSILEMVKHVSAYEQTNVQTIVDMVRLGLPVDAELAAQFEQYAKGDYALLGKMESAAEQVLNLLGSEEVYPEKAVELHHKLVDMILNPETAMQSATDDVEQLLFGGAGNTGATSAEQAQATGKDAVLNMLLGNNGQAGVTVELHTQGQAGEGQAVLSQQTLAQVFSEEQLEQITKMLQSTPTLVDNPDLFITETGEEIFVDTMQEENMQATTAEMAAEEQAVEAKQVLNTELTVERFLKAIQQGLLNKQEFGFLGVQKFFGSREYQSVLKELMQEQWMVRPEELDGGQIKESYKKILQQTGQLEQIVRSTGLEQPQFLQNVADIRGNVEFMNQLNQVYTYVQLPLKLSGQNASGDLYVYTNKKNLSDPDTEVSAFLHLDLEHLGATDVSVKMLRKNVKTNFYFSDDASYELVQRHLPILEAKLNQKGYNCTFTVSNEDKKVDFVQDFLKKDLPSAGVLHRYSFDVRT